MTIWAKPHPLGPEISVDWSPTTDPDATPVWASLMSRPAGYWLSVVTGLPSG